MSSELQTLKKKLEKIFNEYIRLRDKGKPCISCNEFKRLQAGHYFEVGSFDGLRYEEDNVNGECEDCNCYDENHLIGYKKNLIIRIGEDRFYILQRKSENYKKNGNKFLKSELKEKIKYYSKEVRKLKKAPG